MCIFLSCKHRHEARQVIPVRWRRLRGHWRWLQRRRHTSSLLRNQLCANGRLGGLVATCCGAWHWQTFGRSHPRSAKPLQQLCIVWDAIPAHIAVASGEPPPVDTPQHRTTYHSFQFAFSIFCLWDSTRAPDPGACAARTGCCVDPEPTLVVSVCVGADTGGAVAPTTAAGALSALGGAEVVAAGAADFGRPLNSPRGAGGCENVGGP